VQPLIIAIMRDVSSNQEENVKILEVGASCCWTSTFFNSMKNKLKKKKLHQVYFMMQI